MADLGSYLISARTSSTAEQTLRFNVGELCARLVHAFGWIHLTSKPVASPRSLFAGS